MKVIIAVECNVALSDPEIARLQSSVENELDEMSGDGFENGEEDTEDEYSVTASRA